MRRYLLDAPILSALLLRRPVAVQLVTPWIRSREAATSILVYGEVNEYSQGRPDCQQLYAQLREFLVEITPRHSRGLVIGAATCRRARPVVCRILR